MVPSLKETLDRIREHIQTLRRVYHILDGNQSQDCTTHLEYIREMLVKLESVQVELLALNLRNEHLTQAQADETDEAALIRPHLVELTDRSVRAASTPDSEKTGQSVEAPGGDEVLTEEKGQGQKPSTDDEAQAMKPSTDDEAQAEKPSTNDEAQAEKPSIDDEAQAIKPSTDEITPEVLPPAVTGKTGFVYPIRDNDLNKVPRYMLGRLTLEKINKFVTLMNDVLTKKYELMKSRKSGMEKCLLRKVSKWMEQETGKLRNARFCTEEDFKELVSVKLSKTDRSIMVVLKHLKRIREVRSNKKVLCFVACEPSVKQV